MFNYTRFIYCGKADLTKLEWSELLNLSMVADELNIHSLILQIEEYLIEDEAEFLCQEPVRILETVYQHKLHNFCFEIYQLKSTIIGIALKIRYLNCYLG